MLAASLRVGYVAAHPDILQKLADLKMLAGLTHRRSWASGSSTA